MLSYCAQPKKVCSRKVKAIMVPLLYGVTSAIIPPKIVKPIQEIAALDQSSCAIGGKSPYLHNVHFQWPIRLPRPINKHAPKTRPRFPGKVKSNCSERVVVGVM